MSTVYVYRHRGATQEARSADLSRMRKSELLDGLNITGRVLDRAKPYARQHEELRGIQRRIERVQRGVERP